MPKTIPLIALEQRDEFIARHIGLSDDDERAMLAALGVPNLAALIDETVPAAIRLPAPLALAKACPETEALARLSRIAIRARASGLKAPPTNDLAAFHAPCRLQGRQSLCPPHRRAPLRLPHSGKGYLSGTQCRKSSS